MNDLKMINLVNDFPIGGNATTREELLSKIELVSYLARYQEQFSIIENIDDRELFVKEYLSDVMLVTKNEQIPNIELAEQNLKLSSGFVKDFSKIQSIKNNSPGFDETYDSIASVIELEKTSNKII